MFTFLIVLILITAVLLILAVLVQNSKKEGFGSSLGSASASQLIGVKKTTDLLEQVTWGLIITMFVLTLAASLFIKKTMLLPTSPNINQAQEHGTLPTAIPQDKTTPQPNLPTKEE